MLGVAQQSYVSPLHDQPGPDPLVLLLRQLPVSASGVPWHALSRVTQRGSCTHLAGTGLVLVSHVPIMVMLPPSP